VHFPADNFEQKSSESSSRVQSRLLGMRKTSNACVDELDAEGAERARQGPKEVAAK
jgi:hypothetical protein